MSHLRCKSVYRDALSSAEDELGQMVLKFQHLETRKQMLIRAVEVLGQSLAEVQESDKVPAPASIEPAAQTALQPKVDATLAAPSVQEPLTAPPKQSARFPATGVFLQTDEEAERIQRRIDGVLNFPRSA